MNSEWSPIQQRPKDSVTLQDLFNKLLQKLTLGIIPTEHQLLMEVKRQWRDITYEPFSSVNEYIISLIKVMDETMKIFHSISHSEKVAVTVIQGVYVGCMKRKGGFDIWLLVSYEDEKNYDRLLDRVVRWTIHTFPNTDWTIWMVDLMTGQRLMCSQKFGICYKNKQIDV